MAVDPQRAVVLQLQERLTEYVALADAPAVAEKLPPVKQQLERLLGAVGMLLAAEDGAAKHWAQVPAAIRTWVLAAMDVTYVDETRIVDAGFAAEEEPALAVLQRRLDEMEDLCQAYLAANKETAPAGEATATVSTSTASPFTARVEDEAGLVGAFSADVIEALHWRRGALRYMQVATLAQQGRDLSTVPAATYDQGVRFLRRMHAVRGPSVQKNPGAPPPTDESEFAEAASQAEVAGLLAAGVYSSTHLLALIYAGELGAFRTFHAPADANSDAAKECALECIRLYLRLIEEVAPTLHWSATHAREILQKLEARQ